MSSGIVELLESRTVLLDGGMGSSLILEGLADGGCTELWNLEHPERVRAVHEDFLRAGSDVVQTNSFGGNALALARHGVENGVVALNVAAARIAREATLAVGHGLVAGNIGPSGLFRPPVGTATAEQLEGAFTVQARALAEGSVDYFSLETFSDLEEARIAIVAIRAVSQLPITACLTFDRKPRGFFSLMGDTPAKAFAGLSAVGACAVGANCSIGSEDMLAGVAEMLVAAPVPLIVKPNAGLPAIENGRPVYRQEAREFADHVGAMARQGAAAVGGCCGSNHAFIAALRARLDREQ